MSQLANFHSSSSIVHSDSAAESSRANKKALVQALLGLAPVRSFVNLGKSIPGYRKFLNSSLPSWVKFRGVYGSFTEAWVDAPTGVLQGYDHDEIASAYQGQGVLVSDYAAIMHLHKVLPSIRSVFDYGGSVGISFYGWQKYLSYPDKMNWTVCDVPAVVHKGEQIARSRNEERIQFTTDFNAADGADFLLLSGSLQYVETPIWQLLGQLRNLPRYIVINRTPLHPLRKCVTLQNLRWMVSPYHVFWAEEFISEMKSLGYATRDYWSIPDHSCWIPFYPENSVEAYSGLYFELDSK